MRRIQSSACPGTQASRGRARLRRPREVTGHRRFTARSCLRALGPRAGEDVEALCSFVDGRMGPAADLDPIDDPVGC